MQNRNLNYMPNLNISAPLKSLFVTVLLIISGLMVMTILPFTGNVEAQTTTEPGWSTIFDYDVGDFPEHFTTGDVNNDGFLDVVVANLFDDTVTVYFNNGRGKLINRTDFITGTSGNGPRCVVVADVREDNNGDLDIMVSNHYGGTLTVLYNDGTGNFTNPINFSALTDPVWIEAADLNGDGYIDIVCNDFYKNKIGIMFNDQNGGFKLTDTYNVGTHPREFCIADIDGDGDIDIISADLLDDTITVLENIGLGIFTEKDKYKSDPGPRSIAAGDIDGDGDIDIVTANRHADTISILKNSDTIPGNFSSRIEYDCGDTPIKVIVKDIDMDGDLDIAVINLHDNNVQVFNNSGKGNFPSTYLFYMHPGPYHIEIEDLDNDADNDIIISSAYKDKLLTVFRDLPPNIVITEPDGVKDEADLSYTIKWIGKDPDEHNVLSVDIFYNIRLTGDKAAGGRGNSGNDGWLELPNTKIEPMPSNPRQTPTEGEGVIYGIPIVFGTDNDGEYEWDCSLVDNGSYQLAATIYDDYGNYHSVASKYNVTITHNVPPKLIILNPPDNKTVAAHTSFTIRWADSDPDDNAIINISYDNDNDTENGNKGRLLSLRYENKDGDNDKFKWKTSSVPEGEYYIVFEITDGHRDTIINYSDGKVKINHDISMNDEPDITILEPNGVEDMVDASYFIAWIDSDEDDDAEITLYYDDDDADFNGVPIIEGIMEDDDGKASDGTEINMHVWNTSALDDGDYYIYGKIEDGIHSPYYNYSSGPLTISHTINNTKPTIKILEPDGIQDDDIDKAFVIKWDDTDPDDNAVIKLYYSPLKEYFSGQFVEGAWDIPEDNEDDYFIWVTSEIPNGDYYIYALITDNRNDIGKSMSKGPITIKHPEGPEPTENEDPFIEIVEPDGLNDIANVSYRITWVDYDPDDDAFISIYYDLNSSGLKGQLIQNLLSENGEMDEFMWNTLYLPEGDYYIYAIINDGKNPEFSDYSRGPITIDHHLVAPTDIIIPPKARISSPRPNAHYKSGEEVIFDGSESEGHGSIAYTWHSDRDGELSTTSSFIQILSPGTHKIKLYILDVNGQSDTTTVIITVTEEGKVDEIIEGVDDWVIYTFLAMIILLIIIIVAIGVLGKKKPKEEDEDKAKSKKDEDKEPKKGAKASKSAPKDKPKPTKNPKLSPKPNLEPKPKK